MRQILLMRNNKLITRGNDELRQGMMTKIISMSTGYGYVNVLFGKLMENISILHLQCYSAPCWFL